MSLIFKSKLLRNEIKHWLLVGSLGVWGLTATIYAFSKSEKLILVGIDDAGVRLITANSDRLLQAELKSFIKAFFEYYYVYDEKTFLDQIGHATELMSDDLWRRNKDKLLEIQQKLQKTPLSQSMEIETIDLLEQGKIEAVLGLKVRARLNEQKVRLRGVIEFKKHERNEKNPWGFEIVELSDAVI